MQPEDSRLTAIDNVFLLRHAKRLPFEKRDVFEEVKAQHHTCPIDPEIILRFVNEIRFFVGAAWYDPNSALARGSFVQVMDRCGCLAHDSMALLSGA